MASSRKKSKKIDEIITDYEKKTAHKNIIKEKSIGYEHIINKLRRSNLEYKTL